MATILQFRIEGTKPLLIHNGRLADPTYGPAKALSVLAKKRLKTEEDLLNIRKAEWRAGLILNSSNRPCLTGDMLWACLYAGAKKSKRGPQAKAGLDVLDGLIPLEYDGPKDLDKLYANEDFVDYRNVVIGRARVMRCRPKFPIGWGCTFSVQVQTDVISPNEVEQALSDAGTFCGLGDWRPRYGQFVGEVVK